MRITTLGRSMHGLCRALLIALGLIASTAAAAQASATWTGASSSPEWSSTANWTGPTPPISPNRAVGTLSFPTLGRCVTCYTSHDGLTGISATGLVFGNATGQYQILGNGFTLGTGGISDTPGGGAGATINAPLTLAGGPQSWVVGSTANGYNSLSLLGGVSGAGAVPLTISTPRGDVFVDSDMEVGPLTSTGPGTLHIGGAPGTNKPGSLNGRDGQPVAISGGTLIANLGSTSGPLTMGNGTTLLLGTNPQNNGTTSLAVNGTAWFAPTTTTRTFIDADGPTPAADFSQLSASGSITLSGQLAIGQGPSNGTCVLLSPGDVATLVRSGGPLVGQYANAPNGAILTVASACQSPAPRVQIHYTPNSMTATVLGAAPVPPPGISARSRGASAIRTTRATLNGTLSTAGRPVTWQFQYGPRARYNHATPLRAIRAGHQSAISVSATLSWLSPDTRYHYRLVVVAGSSPAADVYGRDLTFTTRATGRLLLRAGTLTVSKRAVAPLARCQSRVRCSGRFSITATARVGRRHSPQSVLCVTRSYRLRAHRGAVLHARVTGRCLAVLRAQPHHRIVARITSRPPTGQVGLNRKIILILR